MSHEVIGQEGWKEFKVSLTFLNETSAVTKHCHFGKLLFLETVMTFGAN